MGFINGPIFLKAGWRDAYLRLSHNLKTELEKGGIDQGQYRLNS